MAEGIKIGFYMALATWMYALLWHKRQLLGVRAIPLFALILVLLVPVPHLVFSIIRSAFPFILKHWGSVYLDVFFHYLTVALVLTIQRKKRKHYCLFTASYLLLCFLLSFGLGILRVNNSIAERIMIHSVQTLYILAYLFAILDERPANIFMSWVIIIVSRELVTNTYGLILNLFGINDFYTISLFSLTDFWDWIVLWVARFLILGVIALLFNIKLEMASNRTSGYLLVFFCSVVFLLTGPMYAVYRVNLSLAFSIPLSIVCKLLYISIYLFILMERSGLLRRSRLAEDLAITEQLLHHERSHYHHIRDNIDIINAKCHDLKRQLNQFQGRLTEEEASVLKEAIELYDSNIKTGSEIFDILIYQKKLYCDKFGISFTYLVDGKLLNFMSNSRLYALLSNAMDNALEAVEKVEDPEKRVINLSVYRHKNTVILELSNYFMGDFDAANPVTSKSDKIHHGFGLKSIRYILEGYHGKLTLKTEDDIFTLIAEIPLPNG